MSIIIDDAGLDGADGKNVYVGNLSWETDDAQLLELVSQYGTVSSAHVEASKSGRSLGYGLVVYASEADASYAIEQLDELDFGGRKIRVRVDRGPTAPKEKKERKAREPREPREPKPRRERIPDEDKVVEPLKVFVMNLNFDTTEDELADHCAQYGAVTTAELLTRGRNNRPSGSAIIEYGTEGEAKAAIAGLEASELGGRPLRVREYYSA
jgi:RNA recognition motif-containing protein